MSLHARERRETELGTEIRCAACGEFWPEDREFFFISGGKVHSWCKACYRADPNTIAKTQRWQDKQRKNPAPAPAPAVDWATLFQALLPIREASC